MENEVLGYKSPLFGRRTAQMKLEGLDYYDAAKMLPRFSRMEQLQIYSCVGGTPHYLAQIDNEETFEENIERLFFDISGYFPDYTSMDSKGNHQGYPQIQAAGTCSIRDACGKLPS